MADLQLTRGDLEELAISDLVDKEDAPTNFASSDVVRWTAKRYLGQPDSAAILALSSDPDGGITLDVGERTGTITITPEDWDDLSLNGDLRFFWDLQLAPLGDETKIVTLLRGEGVILADVTLVAP